MPEREPSIDELVFEYLEARERSEVEGLAVLARLKESSSDGGSALESAIERLTETGLLEGDRIESRTIGPYTVVRRIARGGMGEVFLARPTAGGDEVALKLLRRDLEDDPGSRARLLREVEVVRRLRHPGIAALLDVGEHHGLPYLVFEHVDGVTLENAIRAAAHAGSGERTGADMSLAFDGETDRVELYAGAWSDAVARIGREVARALAHAHARGVVHRDVKPSNVMLTAGGRVVLIDFGLAAVAGADRMTRSGHRVGSLPFMAPELVRGGADATPAADVYSLGVTLFELATLRSPFESRDADRLAVEILVGPSRGARRVDANVSAELARSVACAMESAPAHRYATAEALASDLTELLEGRPIRARSASWPRSVLRWSQRHPWRAAAVFAALFVVVAGPLLFALAEGRQVAELERINGDLEAALARETRAKDDARRAADAAMQAVHDQLAYVSGSILQHVPGGTPARAALVERAFQLLARLPEDSARGESLAWLRASLLGHRARIRAARGDARGADADSAEQESLMRDLLEANPDDARLVYELGALLGQRGNAAWSDGRPAEALPLLGEAEELLLAAAELGWDGPRAPATLLQVRGVLAHALHETGDDDLALETCDRAEQEFEPHPGALDPAVESSLRAVEWYALSDVERVRSLVREELGDAEQSRDASLRCIAAAGRALEESPSHRGARMRIGGSHQMLGRAARRRGDLDAAAEHLDVALRTAREVARDFPGHADVPGALAGALADRANLATLRAEPDLGIGLRRERADLVQAAGFEAAVVARAWHDLAAALLDLAGDDRAALEEAEAVESEVIERIAEERALAGDELVWLSTYLRCLARSRLDDAVGAREDALRTQDRARRGDLEGPRSLRYVADGWCEVLGAMERTEASAGPREDATRRALDHLDAAVAAGYRDLAELRTNPALDPLRAEPRFLAILGRIDGGASPSSRA
ncbi:MAG: serine/threonine-protein kinase [Planctomycetota bacterium]